jgi:multiple sugar transport system substrate-binding protein
MVSVSRASRRDLLKLTALGAASTLAGPSIVRAAPRPLTMMHESSFIPPYDNHFKTKMAAAYEKATGTKINYEVVSVGSLLTRVTTAAENGTGPDMTAIGFNWAYLFDQKFLDVTDIAEEIGKESGGWYPNAAESVVVNGKWKAIPFGNIGQLMNWRTDWFKQAGYEKFPETWDELLEAGIKLKKMGHPFGF